MTRAKDKAPEPTVTEAPAAAAPAAPEPAPVAKPEWPKYLKSMTAFGYTDPETNIHYSPIVLVRIDAAPKEGSWLHSQMNAKLIGEV